MIPITIIQFCLICFLLGVISSREKRIDNLEKLLHFVCKNDPKLISLCHKFWGFNNGEEKEEKNIEKKQC